MKKLYQVTVEYRHLVYAEDEESAENEAESVTTYGICDPAYTDAREIKTFAEIGEDWESSIPYGEESDRTVAQIWEEQTGRPIGEPTTQELESAGQERLF